MVKRKKPNTHNQALGDELENPATHGVRVRLLPSKIDLKRFLRSYMIKTGEA